MSWPRDRRPIVVGAYPDPSPQTAPTWAADEAARRRPALRPVHVGGVPTGDCRLREMPAWEEWNEALRKAGRQAFEEAVDFRRRRRPQEVDAVLAEGDAVRREAEAGTARREGTPP